MTNNILYVSDGDYGTPAGYMLPLVQGQYGQSIPVEVRDLAGNVVNLTGYSVLSATKRKGSSVTAWVGTIALSGTPSAAPQVTVTVDEDDTGDYGGYSFFMELSNGSQALKTHPVSLAIVRDPAVNATAAAGLVGVLSSWRSLLGALYNAAQAATNGQVFVFDGAGSGAEGDAAGGGGPVDVTDLTTTTGSAAQRLRVAGAGGLEYRTTEQDLADLRDAGALATPDLGVTVQGYSAKTAAIAALTWAANSIILLTGTATASVQALAAHIVTLLQSATAADARAAIGAGTGSGDVVGPASSIDNAIARYDLTTGKIIKSSGAGVTDSGSVSVPGGAGHIFSGNNDSGIIAIGGGITTLYLSAFTAWAMRLWNGSAYTTCHKWQMVLGVVGSAQTVIANGAGDVTLVLSGTFTVSDGAGNVAGGIITATAPGGTFNLYDDGGTNTCVLAVAANGSVTVQRTAGSRTYAVNLQLNWM